MKHRIPIIAFILFISYLVFITFLLAENYILSIDINSSLNNLVNSTQNINDEVHNITSYCFEE